VANISRDKTHARQEALKHYESHGHGDSLVADKFHIILWGPNGKIGEGSGRHSELALSVQQQRQRSVYSKEAERSNLYIETCDTLYV